MPDSLGGGNGLEVERQRESDGMAAVIGLLRSDRPATVDPYVSDELDPHPVGVLLVNPLADGALGQWLVFRPDFVGENRDCLDVKPAAIVRS